MIDYLLKPVPFDRFLRAVNKAREWRSVRTAMDASDNRITSSAFFTVFSDYKQVRIYFDDVLYIEGLKDYAKIFIVSSQYPIVTRSNLKTLFARLPVGQFCRVHQSFIVAIKRITAHQKARLFIGTQEIPVGGRFAKEFERVMNNSY
ncbi:LytR/AlgR family response regulator transcription factor [Fibrisoma limi]|nr:LytTR family transcriptional regulator DNA-binding domain-containing protein [Fibrisoma limi]